MQNAQERRHVLDMLYKHFVLVRALVGPRPQKKFAQLWDFLVLKHQNTMQYFLQSQAFTQVDPNDEKPVKQRKMKLIESLNSAQA